MVADDFVNGARRKRLILAPVSQAIITPYIITGEGGNNRLR
jgi:hypothetical protein